MSKWWEEDNETIPAHKFQATQPSGYSEVIVQSEIDDLEEELSHNQRVHAKKRNQRSANHIIRPAQITAHQHNYDPAKFAKADILILTSDASDRRITGFKQPTVNSEPYKRIFAVINDNAADDILLRHNNSNSLAKQRMLLPGNVQVRIRPNGIVHLFYDRKDKRWRVWNMAI